MTNPVTTDSLGRIDSGTTGAWVEAPDYDLTVTGTGITSYTLKVRNSQILNAKSYGVRLMGPLTTRPRGLRSRPSSRTDRQ